MNGLYILQPNAFDVESRNIDQKVKLGNGQANGIKIGFSKIDFNLTMAY